MKIKHEHLIGGGDILRQIERSGLSLVEAFGCPICREVLRRWWSDDAEPEAKPASYDAAVRGALDDFRRQLARPPSTTEAAQLSPEQWLRLSSAQRRLRLSHMSKSPSFELCRRLVQRAEASLFISLGTAQDWLRLAFELLEYFGSADRPDLAHELTAESWRAMAMVYKAQAQFRASEAAIGTAFNHLRQGSGDPLEWARSLECLASLRNAQRCYPAAFRPLAQAIRIYRSIGDREREARAWLSWGFYEECRESSGAALQQLDHAQVLFGTSISLRDELFLRHNQVVSLCSLGRLEWAKHLYHRHLRPLYERRSESGFQVRHEWIRGTLARAHREADAEDRLTSVRDTLRGEGRVQDGAMASLELAELYRDRGSSREAQAIAEEILPVFRSLGMTVEIAKATRLLQGQAGSPPQRK